jgi:glycosyltransferase involved in cell wall biosynthesis
MRLSVIVPAHDAAATLGRTLAALRAQELDEPFEVIVVDDGSTDETARIAEREDNVRLVSDGKPLGPGPARNSGVAVAQGELLAFTDADCYPTAGWLRAGLAALADADLVQGAVRPDPGVDEMPFDRSVWVGAEVGLYETANLFVRRETFENVGGFDGTLPNAGDFDFVSRCVASGSRLVVSREAVVHHPALDRARPLLKKVWTKNCWYAAREARAGRKPLGLRLREWVPLVQPLRSRRRFEQSLGLDRRRLADCGVTPSLGEQLAALPFVYIVLPYFARFAQLRGWWIGRQARAAG